jgi:hypothetical protein
MNNIDSRVREIHPSIFPPGSKPVVSFHLRLRLLALGKSGLDLDLLIQSLVRPLFDQVSPSLLLHFA